MNIQQPSEKSPLFKANDDHIQNDQIEYASDNDNEGYNEDVTEIADDNFSQFRVEDYL